MNYFSKDERDRRRRAKVRRALKRLRTKSRRRWNDDPDKKVHPFHPSDWLNRKERIRFDALRWENYYLNSHYGDDVSGIEFTPDKHTALGRISDAYIGVDTDKRVERYREANERAQKISQEPRILVTFETTEKLNENGHRTVRVLYNGSPVHPVYGKRVEVEQVVKDENEWRDLGGI